MAIYFEEEYAHNKSGPFVPVDKRMIADYSHHVGSRHVYGVRSVTIRMELQSTSKSGPKKPYVPNAGSTTIERQKPIMEREGITLVNPDRLSHLASEWRVFR
jgi:hypothetical protein